MSDLLILNKDKDGMINHAGFKIDTTGVEFFGNLFKLQKPIFYSSLEPNKIGKCNCDLNMINNENDDSLVNDPYIKLLDIYLDTKKLSKTRRHKKANQNKTKKKHKN